MGLSGVASDFLASIGDVDAEILEPQDDPVEIPGAPLPRVGRPRTYSPDRPATAAERQARSAASTRSEKAENRLDHVAVLDFETDPFDKETDAHIAPFTACLYSRNFEPVIIWDENEDSFLDKVIAAIEELPGAYTIYAHNGGKFDFMFFIHKLRGKLSFKGRGLMSAKIGRHELRDSFHIIPEKLASFHKEEFDYSFNLKKNRNARRKQIIAYMVSDCEYLYDIVMGFLSRFGFKISIGQAAMSELRKHYKVGRIGAKVDETLREFFFGGRVECLAGRGHFVGPYKLYDRNSMYPAAMAQLQHPIGSHYIRRERKSGPDGDVKIGPDTFFLDITCRNYGALVVRRQNPDTHEWETTTEQEYGRFKTTIWEYNTALELGLISNIKIHAVIDCAEKSDFSKHILPLYVEKEEASKRLRAIIEKDGGEGLTPHYWEAKQQYMFCKFILNNSYGKFAQNPRNYKETFITGPDDPCPDGYDQLLPSFRNEQFAIWERPALKQGFVNVGTAASITGASRADLMRVIHGATDPIYCDTDSVICRAVDASVPLHPTALGAWDLEKEMDEVIIAGKKLYYYGKIGQEAKGKVKSKGASGLNRADMLKLLDGEIIATKQDGPTLTRNGRQFYMKRKIRATAPLKKNRARKTERVSA